MTHTHTEGNTFPSRPRCMTTLFQAAKDLSGTPCFIYLFALSELTSPTREGHGPRTLALKASQRFVYRQLTVRVIIVYCHCCPVNGSQRVALGDTGRTNSCQATNSHHLSGSSKLHRVALTPHVGLTTQKIPCTVTLTMTHDDS